MRYYIGRMFITTHALIGALIGEQIPNSPVWAFALGVASHFLTDIIPHGDSNLYKGYVSGARVKRALAYVTIDALVAMMFVLGLFNTGFVEHRAAISTGIIGSVLPDLLVAMYEIFRVKKLRWLHRVHFFFHNMITGKRGDIPLVAGIAMQLVVLVFLVVRAF
jgi:hypothetical protein